MRSQRSAATDVFNNPILIGTITLLVVAVAVYLSYIAENGLPFIPTYDIKVQVADAAELVKNADVRIGGARVGQVLTITPEPATSYWPHPYALLGLALDKDLEPLPSDTKYQVRLASVLGGKYVEIIPGNDRAQTVPDGATLRLNTNPALNHDIPFVDLDQAFDVFGPKTQTALRSATAALGDAFAGRGTQINDTIHSARELIGPFDNLLALFSSSTTNLSGFISGLASTTAALAPVAPTFSALLADGATTFAALDTPALGTTIDDLPDTESVATTVLTNSLPVLQEAATITEDLKPAATYLPTASQHLDEVLRAAPATFKLVPAVARALQGALTATSALAKDPAATETFKVLGTNDLGTFGSSAFVGLGAILDTVANAQLSCNVVGLWVRAFASALSEGDSSGSWLRFSPVLDTTELLQASSPSSDFHIDSYPQEDSSGCGGANDVYSGATAINNPGKVSTTVDATSPPPGVLAEGAKAGLVP
jgi:virulence factor Mce-like protein